MIYNLREYLETKFPNETFFVNMADESQPDRRVIISEIAGQSEAITNWTNKGLQVLTRDVDPVKARLLAFDILDELRNTFDLNLSAVTVDGHLYPAVLISQISDNGEPQPIGEDENGRFEFTTNYRILYRRN
jgi:hypothetical protein